MKIWNKKKISIWDILISGFLTLRGAWCFFVGVRVRGTLFTGGSTFRKSGYKGFFFGIYSKSLFKKSGGGHVKCPTHFWAPPHTKKYHGGGDPLPRAPNISMELWLTTGGNVFGYVGKYSESNEFLTVSDPRKKIAKLGRCLTKNFFFYFWTCLGEWGKRKKTLSSTLVLFPGTF